MWRNTSGKIPVSDIIISCDTGSVVVPSVGASIQGNVTMLIKLDEAGSIPGLDTPTPPGQVQLELGSEGDGAVGVVGSPLDLEHPGQGGQRWRRGAACHRDWPVLSVLRTVSATRIE